MSATLTRAVAPIMKIRAALRERATRPAASAANVVCITDSLMLGWAESEVALRQSARASLAAVQDELADLRRLAGSIVTHSTGSGQAGEREVSALEKILVFTKLESAAGLTRQTFNALALCSLLLVAWVSIAPDNDCGAMLRAKHSTRVVRVVKRVTRREGFDGITNEEGGL